MKRLLCAVLWVCAVTGARGAQPLELLEQNIVRVLDSWSIHDEIPLITGVRLRRSESAGVGSSVGRGGSVQDEVLERIQGFARTHVLDVRVPELLRGARALAESTPRFAFGKNTFLTGFGLGFLAFGLKKLLLPLFIGAQIVKSVLLALFLPSIIGSISRLAGKGLTTVAQGSSSSAQHAGAGDTISDFDFKDQTGGGGYDSLGAGSDDGNAGVWTYPPDNTFLQTASRQPFPAYTASGLGATSSALVKNQQNLDRFQKFHYDTTGMGLGAGAGGGMKHHGSFYSHDKRQDYKIFHNIPSSSQLLANYDPFYSPLLSRLDSVFQQLGQREESCRERLVCDMYNNPAKYAPFSNLVSAQLSRELNELRKPSSDNPEILRFFRYMKAAKDGQDGQVCAMAYGGCDPAMDSGRPPMVTTFNDINKLVQARKLNLADQGVAEELLALVGGKESLPESETRSDSIAKIETTEESVGNEGEMVSNTESTKVTNQEVTTKTRLVRPTTKTDVSRKVGILKWNSSREV